MSDLRQSPLWAEYMRTLGWQTEKVDGHYAYIIGFFFLNFGKILRFNSKLDLKKADQFFKDKKVLMVKLEPDFSVTEAEVKTLNKAGFKPDVWALAPTKTIVLDLTLSQETLLQNMEKDTRYCVRSSEKKGVVVRETADFEDFYTLYQQTSKRGKFWIESKKNLTRRWEIFSRDGKAKIFTAFHGKEILATAMVYYHEKTAYYLYAGSSTDKRDYFAPYLLVWEIIKHCQKEGFKKLDLEGIYDPRIPTTSGWKGFTHFKKGFRGEELASIGTFTKVYNPVLRVFFDFFNRFG